MRKSLKLLSTTTEAVFSPCDCIDQFELAHLSLIGQTQSILTCGIIIRLARIRLGVDRLKVERSSMPQDRGSIAEVPQDDTSGRESELSIDLTPSLLIAIKKAAIRGERSV